LLLSKMVKLNFESSVLITPQRDSLFSLISKTVLYYLHRTKLA
jgi:hypothetical protein